MRTGGSRRLAGEDADEVTDVPEVRNEQQRARDGTQVPGSWWTLHEARPHPVLGCDLGCLAPAGSP
jgi:hypothetical protein